MADTLIALGGAHNVWDDFAEAKALCEQAGVDYDVGATNDAGAAYSGYLTLWCSLHPEKMQRWQKQRANKKLNSDYVVVCHKERANTRIDRAVPEVWSGASGLFICQVAAITFKYARIIVCGVPMTEEGHFFDSTPWRHSSKYWKGWREAVDQPELYNRVRSMSGNTRQLVGPPDTEWLLSAVPSRP